ncbi:MAG: dihydrolipoamide succinyltransferase [Gammaproteobacteria bacterium]|jgi:2-oxoglutarate dehydrogenase E2 component (dihydrolipoamide succinyltransferase)|nr:dihydrolipoamide succinyltransferase [Gammaproteobacteria bacterium]
MSIEIKVPVLPESVADATIVTWHKKPGDFVKRDENLVDLETDKVVLEVPAPEDGVLAEILKGEGDTVTSNEILATLKAGAAQSSAAEAKPVTKVDAKPTETEKTIAADLSPSVRRLVGEHNVDASQVKGSGKDGRITKEDVRNSMSQPAAAKAGQQVAVTGTRPEQRVPMNRMRARIAERLLEVKQTTAMLTTFNEVNLQAVMNLRSQYKDSFEKKHGVKLGFMSFFTKAAVEALKRFPAVNASIDGNDVVYHGYYDIGIAVSTERGLVVPVLRDADSMSLAGIEKNLGDYAGKARAGKLSMEEMTGGTFTITNGGVFGSLLSTPIINSPQTAILGMHKIQERPVAENGQVVIRPMMYLALSYDHRLIDGKESVQFLVTIKELLEDPARMLLDI